MDEEITQEGGITIGQIFRTIFSEKWLALIIAAAITLLGTLGLYFTGKRNEVYSVSFVLQLPGADPESAVSYTYPDGSRFYYTDLISYDSLKEVASREGFEGVKVDKMHKNGDISISINNSSQSGDISLSYTVSVKSKYFKGKSVARNFIDELISLPAEHIGSMYINYDKSLTAAKSIITYGGQLDKLKEQAEFILEKYDAFIKLYGTDLVIKDGKILGYYQAQLETFLNKNSTLDNLKTWALTNKYVMGDEEGNPLQASIEQYKADILTKKAKRDEIQNALDTLYAGTDGQTSVIVDATVLEYALQLEQLKKEIEYYETDEGNYKFNADFDKAVNAAEAQVEAFTTEFATISSIVYQNNTTVSYRSTKIVEVSGGRGIAMSLIISLVLGVIVAAIVAYIVGWSKQKKAAASKVAEIPAQSAELQTTDETKEKTTSKDKK